MKKLGFFEKTASKMAVVSSWCRTFWQCDNFEFTSIIIDPSKSK